MRDHRRLLLSGALRLLVPLAALAAAGTAGQAWADACCHADGTCDDVDPGACLGSGGSPRFGQDCVTGRCDVTGACCTLTDETCSEVTEAECGPGLWRGLGTGCFPFTCTEPRPCCDRGVVPECALTPVGQCLLMHRIPQPGVTCDGVTCPPAWIVPCCPGPFSPFTTCTDMDHDECYRANGTPSDRPCGEPGACEAAEPLGACCDAAGACTDATSQECALAAGTWLGEGSACATWSCLRPCCLPDDSCVDSSPGACLARGGESGDPGSTCATVDCSLMGPPGRVPDGTPAAPGVPLGLRITARSRVDFAWSPSCGVADGYFVYGAPIGRWTGADCIAVVADGTSWWTWVMPGNLWYVVVPHDQESEGSYGHDSFGRERPVGNTRCRWEQVIGCD